jgi:predicted nucleotidyltransferase
MVGFEPTIFWATTRRVNPYTTSAIRATMLSQVGQSSKWEKLPICGTIIYTVGENRELMFEQDRVIVRLQQRVLQEADVLVCLLTGSYGRRQADPYSDIDVMLLFGDEERRAAAFDRRRSFVQSVLPYVPAKSFDAVHVRPFLHVALYSNGAKVDYLYETQANVKPSPWLRETRLLKDTSGWGERFQTEAAGIAPGMMLPSITAAALADLDDRFWVMFWDAFRLLLRGDHVKPFPIYLEFAYFTLMELVRLLPPEDPAHQALIQAEFSHDTQATLAHMRRLFTAYLEARTAVVRRHNLVFERNRSFETAVRRLVERDR